MTRIPSLAAVLLALALPSVRAEKPAERALLRTIALPDNPGRARAAAASAPQVLTPAPVAIIDSPPADVTDGGSANWGFHVENAGTSPLPGPFTIDYEVSGLSNPAVTPAGWTCTPAPAASCTWPSDLAPGDSTG